jgi:hemerythrin-like domain-containing protein
MTMTPVTEPLRAEHRELLPHLAELDQTPGSLRTWSTEQALDRLGAIVGFLRGHLIPHATAEDEVLYPAVEDAMGAPGATATMRADHTEVVVRIDRLAATVDTVADRWPDPDLVDDVAVQLAGLSAIINLHFRKEEDVLLPELDRSLTHEAAEELFSRMGHAAHGH